MKKCWAVKIIFAHSNSIYGQLLNALFLSLAFLRWFFSVLEQFHFQFVWLWHQQEFNRNEPLLFTELQLVLITIQTKEVAFNFFFRDLALKISQRQRKTKAILTGNSFHNISFFLSKQFFFVGKKKSINWFFLLFLPLLLTCVCLSTVSMFLKSE